MQRRIHSTRLAHDRSMSDESIDIDQALGPAPEVPHHGRLHRMRRTMMAGVTVIAPLWITGFVLWALFSWADEAGRTLFSKPLIRPFAAMLGNAEWYHKGIGFVLTLFIIWAVGLVTTNVLGRRVVQHAREALERLPLVLTIYTPVRKLLETMTSPSGFKQVVLFEYPRRGTWTLGFVAGDVPFEDDRPPAHSIFVPTAPNPTTGFMLIVPPEEIRPTGLSVEAAFQMIVSAGVAVPMDLKLPASIAASSRETISVETIARAAGTGLVEEDEAGGIQERRASAAGESS